MIRYAARALPQQPPPLIAAADADVPLLKRDCQSGHARFTRRSA